MNYELAKELKEAGFPRGDHNEIHLYWGTKEVGNAPTLEELIEECGDDFVKLVRNYPKAWYADSKKIDTEDYPTPTEAVARLLISLYNSKNEKKAS